MQEVDSRTLATENEAGVAAAFVSRRTRGKNTLKRWKREKKCCHIPWVNSMFYVEMNLATMVYESTWKEAVMKQRKVSK